MIHLAYTNIKQFTRYGVKYFCSCGVSKYSHSIDYSTDINNVTCKKCKADYNRRHKNDRHS